MARAITTAATATALPSFGDTCAFLSLFVLTRISSSEKVICILYVNPFLKYLSSFNGRIRSTSEELAPALPSTHVMISTEQCYEHSRYYCLATAVSEIFN